MSEHQTEPVYRKLIFTADDFGQSISVNEAVEQAHQNGVLTCASLMVGASGAEDAVRRARRLQTLAVGLHLVLCNGQALSRHQDLPDLVDEAGRLPANMVAAGFQFFLSRRMQQQLEHEIKAQFKAFEATGLPLDHVNVHKHFHVHPTLLRLIFKVGQDYGMSAIRLPAEPLSLGRIMRRHVPSSSTLQPALLWPLMERMRRHIRQAQVLHNDYIVGLSASGRMTAELMLDLFPKLPAGVGEIYFHPDCVSEASNGALTSNQGANSDLLALLDPRIPVALNQWRIHRRSFHDAA